MTKPKEILDLEKHLGFTLTEIRNFEDISDWKKGKAYLLDDNKEVIGLNLWGCELANLSFLQDLSHLISLNLIANQISDIPFLQDLPNLKNLELSANRISNISFLQNLTNLTTLYLWNNQISDISFLQNLTNLTSLHLSHNQISDISFLQGLTNLTRLDLGGNQISNISFLQHLANLTELNIGTNRISDISFLKNLVNLTILNINDNQISDISILQSLTNLTSLGLSENQISDYSFLRNLIKLKSLRLLSNQISDISFLQGLTNLTRLDLGGNQISNISLSFLNHFPKLQHLSLHNNPIQDIPKEILDKEENVLQEIRNYLEALEEDGKIPNDQIKMLLLGNSTAGKTSLIEFLKDGTYEEKKISTHGIQNLIWQPFEKDAKASETEKNIKVSVWDFGGQEFYHNTHSLFFSHNAIYLVLFEVNTNFQGKKRTHISLYEDGIQIEKEIDLEHFEFSYWLENVKYLNNNKQGVLLLTQNKCDLGQIDISDACKKEYQLQSEVNIFAISIKKAFEQDKKFLLRFEMFKTELGEQIKSNIATFDNSKKWQEIKNTIQSDWKNDNVLEYAEYVRRCKEIKSTIDDRKEGQAESQLDTLTNILREQGIVLQYKHIPELQDKIFVNPAWLTDSIYKVLDYSVIKSAGKFDKAHLEKIAQSIPKIKADELLALLLHFNLIFEIERMNKQWFICPQYLPESFGEEDFYAVESYREINDIQYSFTLSYPQFLPVSTFLKFLAKHGKKHIYYWYNKNELLFIEKPKAVYAKCLRTKEEKTITICVENADAKIAQKLFEEFLSIDFPFDLQVSVNEGKDFVEVKKLKNKIENEPNATQIESTTGKSLDIRDFEIISHSIKLINEENKMKPEIYISYSWKPDSNAVAEQIESQFESQLKHCGIELIRDKINGVGYMESISNFMNQIGKGKYILIVLGNDYLKSPNCMYELCKIYQASEGDFQKMKERIFIVTLDNIKIYNAQDRASLILYWEQEIKSLNDIIKKSENVLNQKSQMKDLELFDEILNLLRKGAVSDISDLNTLSTKTHQKEGFKTVISRLAAKLKEDGFEVDISKVELKGIENLKEEIQVQNNKKEENPCQIPNIIQPTGSQVKLLIEALSSAFPSITELAKFVRLELDKNLNTITGSSNVTDAAFDLITYFESEGKLRDLISEACQAKPNNPQMKEFVKSL